MALFESRTLSMLVVQGLPMWNRCDPSRFVSRQGHLGYLILALRRLWTRGLRADDMRDRCDAHRQTTLPSQRLSARRTASSGKAGMLASVLHAAS